MIDLLSQANDTATAVIGGGVGLVVVLTGVGIKHIINNARHVNGSQLMFKDVCNERTSRINESLERIETKLESITVVKLADHDPITVVKVDDHHPG